MQGRRFTNATAAIFVVYASSTLGAMQPRAAVTKEQIKGSPAPLLGYLPASNRDIRVSVERVLVRGDKEFLPKDKHWLQLELRVSNIGKRMVQMSDVKVKFTDGTVTASAQAGTELAKAPSLTNQMGKSIGFGVGGQLAGMMIFPPLAIVASAASVINMLGGNQKWSKRLEKIHATMLARDNLAPETSMTGFVYIPAVEGQTGLIAFYTVDGSVKSLTIHRATAAQ